MEIYTTEPEKVVLNKDMDTKRNHLIIKNIRQTQNFQRYALDFKNSKHSHRCHFK